MDLRHEPVRIPGYVALVAAMIVAGLSAFVAGGVVAGVIAAAGVLVPGAIGVEYARTQAWSPASVETVVGEALHDDPATSHPRTPERYLSDARAFDRY